VKLLAIGGDARNAYLVSRATQQGMEAHGAGHSGIPAARAQDVREADVVVLPDMRILESAPYAAMADQLKRDAEIYIYACPQAVNECCGCGRKTINLLRDEEYVQANARLTAEGALVRAAEGSRGALMGARATILGFGRIAQALTRRLLVMETQVWVAARREEARKQAEAMGAQAVPVEEAVLALRQADFVFNTVPARILGEDELRSISKCAVLMELASAPHGFEQEMARELGLKVLKELGLPGRYCPRSAAAVMLDAIVRLHKGGGQV